MSEARHTVSIQAGWTDEREELLGKLWKQGESAGFIAKTLGNLTRSAVIGKARRLKLPPHSAALKHANLKTDRAKRARAAAEKTPRPKRPRASETQEARVAAPKSKRPLDVKPSEPLPGTNPRPWTTRRFGECAFPFDGPEEALSCCEPVAGERYCAAHRAIMFRKADIRPRKDRLRVEPTQRWAA